MSSNTHGTPPYYFVPHPSRHPATAAVGKRLAWAAVVAIGQHVRQVEVGDRVLYDPEDRAEVELHGGQYVLLRERDIHAVAAPRVDDGQTGLYL